MTNAEKIRQMTDEQMGRFLWMWKINSITGFLENGGQGGMNAIEIEKWLNQSEDTFVCLETYVDSNDWIFDQDFNTKVVSDED